MLLPTPQQQAWAARAASQSGAANAGCPITGLLCCVRGSWGLLPGQWPALLLRGRHDVPVLCHRVVQGSADMRCSGALPSAPTRGDWHATLTRSLALTLTAALNLTQTVSLEHQALAMVMTVTLQFEIYTDTDHGLDPGAEDRPITAASGSLRIKPSPAATCTSAATAVKATEGCAGAAQAASAETDA